jgi:hypothetical protein
LLTWNLRTSPASTGRWRSLHFVGQRCIRGPDERVKVIFTVFIRYVRD